MVEIRVPLSITYETAGSTPIVDVIAALHAADAAIEDAISLLPSLIDGVHIENSQINVRLLSQQSPLRELLLVTLLVAFQDDLNKEIPPMLEDIFKTNIPDSYDSIVTVVTMVVLFYGAAFLKDAAIKAVEDGALRHQVDSLISQLADSTGKSEEEIKRIFDTKYGKPAPVRRLARAVRGFFIPSQREGGAPVTFDRKTIDRDVVREVPYPQEFAAKEDFEKYQPINDVVLDIHAQDKDKVSVGWAAVPRGITEKRLRMKIIEPITANDLWNKDTIRADITLIHHLAADGYVPAEIHLIRIRPN
ncbi:hypothetical protein A6U97_14750 [Agrobacterium tumefaciens]|uniref:hypothetical protein n=1 Tax=Agrobacterium tumefaciens TaxID=358 RepID=UPI000810039C|nr:hypothetical protein A6U97_14750 [Agrobacterium tumefaciens]